jgi:hypothetical protein
MHSANRHAALVLLLLLAPVWATAVGPGVRRLGDTAYVAKKTAQPVVLQAMLNVSISDLDFQASWC